MKKKITIFQCMKNFEVLNEYLSFSVLADAEVPQSTGKAKVMARNPPEIGATGLQKKASSF